MGEHGEHPEHALLESQVQAINRFPDQNPNPVLRISDEGHLTYANIASEPVRRALGAEVGDAVPAEILGRLRAAASQPGERVEVVDGIRFFALLPVPVVELGFMNVYGTDITAEKVVERFPNENPNPVFRVDDDGVLIYANAASQPLIGAFGMSVGDRWPDEIARQVLAAADSDSRELLELEAGARAYALRPVRISEFGFINVYGTDITATREVARAKDESDRLLLNILPASIADRLRANEEVIADRFEDATLLIADIVGFTQVSSELSADELVAMLNKIFTALDVLVERHGLEKVKTIGDAYMVIGGVPVAVEDHVERVADMALDMTEAIASLQEELARPITCRIGINCGPVVAGVIGTKRTIYDVWGDTVNMASRMESLGMPGRIQVTPAVYERLRGRYQFAERGPIEVKGKGMMRTYFLTGRL